MATQFSDDLADVTARDYGLADENVGDEEYAPPGYATQEEYIQRALELFESDRNYDNNNRIWAMEDLEFVAGDQWDPIVKRAREEAYRPCMTINVLPQFVGQVVGDRRLNKTTIKVRPFRDGTQEVADVRSGLIKSIELYSRAERAYDAACEDQTACGISALRVDLDYAANDVFDQDIFIRHIPNPLAVIWDRMSVDPTGRDAQHCFVIDRIPTKEYNKRFPDKPMPTGFTDNQLTNSTWTDDKTVQICEFWEMIQKPATFAMMQDGDIKDVTGMAFEEYEDQLWINPQTEAPLIRESYRTYARMHLVTSFAILSEPYEVPLDRLPIIKVEGRVVRVGEDRVRFGLVRFAKDAQRLKNYWRSVAAEVLALAPKAQWAGPADAFEGREDAFRKAHLTGSGPLMWNKNASAPPTRVDPPPVPAALLQEAQMNAQDIKDTTGLHEASLGMRSNEISGRAIEARKAEGDVATVIYHDNLNQSIQEVGSVVNQLIPIAYDTVRTVRVVGPDDKHVLKVVNDPTDDASPDITKGKYDVVLETGPSFTTQRQEALNAMMTLLQTSPEMMGVIGDLVAKNMDWPGAYEIYERLRKLPSIQQFIQDEDGEGGEPTPEQLQQMAAMEQEQAVKALLMEQEQEKMALELAEQAAKTMQAQKAAEEAEARVRQAQAQADEAEAKAAQARFEATNAPAVARHKMDLAERSASAKGVDKSRGAPRPQGSKQPSRKDKQ